MSGNIQGGQKTKQKLIAKLGEEEYSKRMADMGYKGGIAHVPKGFAKSGLAQEAGRKGGGARRIYLDESLGGIKKMLELKDKGATYEEIGTYFGVKWWVIRARYVESVHNHVHNL
jgi:general stress protein YciG